MPTDLLQFDSEMIVHLGIHSALLRRIVAPVLALAVAASGAVVSPAVAGAATETTFTFNGGGWGHGIGLSQWGTRGYALQGKKYDWILAHYYQGTKLVTKPAVTVRVNLNRTAAARNAWKIKAGTSTALTLYQVSNTSIKITLDATNAYWVVTGDGNTAVYRDAGGYVGTLVKRFTGACAATSGGRVQMLSVSGPWDQSGIIWRGSIRFNPATATTSKAINHVNIEQYLYGVVPRESPSSWPTEALKAQAVAARSYAYQDAKDGRTLYCTTMSQVYAGVSRPGYAHEAATTNAAVDATRGQLVWYGSETKPVRTFFSSSSGGHTASIQDVWTSSTPKPYYTGVPDADSDSNANYRWTAGPFTASTVSSKLRQKDSASVSSPGLDYSAPYPHKVISMSPERASSGYVRFVTLRWSNGQSFRVTGDTIRSALSLKSTKFSILTLNPGVLAHEQTDPLLAWYGPWSTGTNEKVLSGGSMAYAAGYASQMIAEFEGTGFNWIGNKAPSYGIAKVYIDEKLVASVDLYSSTTTYQTKVFSKSGLTDGTHRVRIVVTGKKNAKSRGTTVAIDRFDVTGTLRQAVTFVSKKEDSDRYLAWFGTWGSNESTRVSGGTQAWTGTAGAEVHIRFTGTGISWIGSSSSKYGAADVILDNQSPLRVVLTSQETTYGAVHWSVEGLDRSKTHSLIIRAVGPESPDTNGYISVDRFDITGGWIVPPSLPTALVESTSSSIAYAGTWSTGARPELSGGSHAYSKSAGSEARLVFDGSTVSWVAAKSPAYGKAEVWLDGSRAATIDLYSSARLYRQTVWRSSTLPARRHTLTIKVLGTKNRSATGNYVSVDALNVTGRVVAP